MKNQPKFEFSGVKDWSEVSRACEAWRKKHKPECTESLMQVDSINEGLVDLVEEIGEALGWWVEDLDD